MSGLIWSALGQSLGQASSTVGNLMYRDIEREDRQEERRRELEERRAYERDRDALYRRTVEQQMAPRASGSGSAGGGGIAARDMADGGGDEAMVARAAGMTVPEMRALRRYSETGDSTPFMRNVERDVDMPDPENPDYNTIRERRIAQELPPGFDREARAKMQMLARIEESYRLGKDYDNVAKGREAMQGVDFANRAASNPASAGVLGQAMAVREGKPLIDEGGGEMFNQYTGTSRTTPKGESEIGENRAQAAKAADARKAAADASDALKSGASQEKLATMLSSLNKLADSPDLDDASRSQVQAVRMSIVKEMERTVQGRAGAPNAPRGGGPSEQPPDLSSIQGLPKTASVRGFVEGRGWEVINDGKVIGYVQPSPRGGAKASPAAAPAAAPAPVPAPADQADAPGQATDSRAARWRERQARIKQEGALWNSEQAERAKEAFAALDLRDAQAAAELQGSPLFAFLTTKQKAAVQRAVMGR